MANAVRRTLINADLYTREADMSPEDRVALYVGDSRANELVVNVTNQGEDVDVSGFTVMLRFVRKDNYIVLGSGAAGDDGKIHATIPTLVYAMPGAVSLTLTLISADEIVTVLQTNFTVQGKLGIMDYTGVDTADLLPTYEALVAMIRQLEVALGYVLETDPSDQTVADRIQALEAFRGRIVGFATAEQGQKADAALPASEFTPENVLGMVIAAGGGGDDGGTLLNADTLDGKHAVDFALAGHAHDGSDTPRIAYGNIEGTPSALPADGGNADTLGGEGPEYYATAAQITTINNTLTRVYFGTAFPTGAKTGDILVT